MTIDTDTFVRNFVTKTCRNIIDDVEKLNAVQDEAKQYNRVAGERLGAGGPCPR